MTSRYANNSRTSSDSSLAILNKTRRRLPSLPFFDIKNAVLGKNYDLSLVFIGSTRSRTLNKKYRGKDKPANVLSFPLSKTAGEIFIDLSEAKRQAVSYDKTYRKFVGFLLIHGLFHLKGFDHSSTMERKEESIRKQFLEK